MGLSSLEVAQGGDMKFEFVDGIVWNIFILRVGLYRYKFTKFQSFKSEFIELIKVQSRHVIELVDVILYFCLRIKD